MSSSYKPHTYTGTQAHRHTPKHICALKSSQLFTKITYTFLNAVIKTRRKTMYATSDWLTDWKKIMYRTMQHEGSNPTHQATGVGGKTTASNLKNKKDWGQLAGTNDRANLQSMIHLPFNHRRFICTQERTIVVFFITTKLFFFFGLEGGGRGSNATQRLRKKAPRELIILTTTGFETTMRVKQKRGYPRGRQDRTGLTQRGWLSWQGYLKQRHSFGTCVRRQCGNGLEAHLGSVTHASWLWFFVSKITKSDGWAITEQTTRTVQGGWAMRWWGERWSLGWSKIEILFSPVRQQRPPEPSLRRSPPLLRSQTASGWRSLGAARTGKDKNQRWGWRKLLRQGVGRDK